MTTFEKELFYINKLFFSELSPISRYMVFEYFRISCESIISESNLDRINIIWERAEQDEQLSYALEKIDFMLCDPNIDKYEDMQYFLNEHLEIIVNQKNEEFKYRSKEDKEILLEDTVLLCPDGSGFTRLTIDEFQKGKTIDELGNSDCKKCGHPLKEHRASIKKT